MATSNKKKMFLAASIAGLMTVSTTVLATHAQAEETSAPCYGVNACKGTGDCGGKGYSCHGKNACKGQGFIKLPTDICTRIEGGRLTV